MQTKRKQRKKWSKIFHKNLTRLKEEETITTTSPSNFSMQTKSESLMENFPKKNDSKEENKNSYALKRFHYIVYNFVITSLVTRNLVTQSVKSNLVITNKCFSYNGYNDTINPGYNEQI